GWPGGGGGGRVGGARGTSPRCSPSQGAPLPRESTCKLPHAWLRAGPCPWCGVPVGPASERSERRWNVPALLAALDHPEPAVRECLLRAIRRHGPALAEALRVLHKALADPDPGLRSLTTTVLHLRGDGLSAEEA